MADDSKSLYVIDLTDKFSPKVKKADKTFDKFDNSVKKSTTKSGGIGSFSSMLSSGLMVGGVAALGTALLAGTKKVLDLGAAMEQTRVSFSVMFGSADKGNEMLDMMNEFANVTPFTNDKVIQAGKTLKAFDFQASEIAPTLKLLGDVAAGTGTEFSELATIFGRIKSNGRIQGEELNQLIDRGFNPLNDIAKKTGKSMAELRKDMSKGLISFDMIQDSFIAATSKGGQFEDMMAKQSKTFTGLTSTISGKLGAMFATAGEGLAGALKPLLEWTISFIDMLPRFDFSQITRALSSMFSHFKPITEVLKTLFGTMGEGIEVIDLFQFAINRVAATIRFLTLPFRALSSVITTVIEFFRESIDMSKSFSVNVGRVFINLVNKLKPVIDAFQGLGKVIAGAFTMNPTMIAEGVTSFKSGVGTIFNSAKNVVANELGAFGEIFNTKAKGKSQSAGLDALTDFSLLAGGSASGAGGANGAASSGSRSKVSGNVAGVSSGGIKNVTLNIDKLIEQITFESTSGDSMEKVKEMVTRVLVEASSDATRIIGT